MLQDFATSLSTTLAVASLLFFVVVYVVVTVRAFRTGVDELDKRARMALEPSPPTWTTSDDTAERAAEAAPQTLQAVPSVQAYFDANVARQPLDAHMKSTLRPTRLT